MEQDRMTEGLPNGLSKAMDQLLAHPELLTMVASALGKSADTQGSHEPSPPVSVAPSPPSETASVTKVASPVAEAPPPVAEVAPSVTDTPVSATSAPTDLVATLAPILTGLAGKGLASKKDDPRACLLRALKPYVNPARREAIDYMIRLSQISELFRSLT